jgi:hypothetical protein
VEFQHLRIVALPPGLAKAAAMPVMIEPLPGWNDRQFAIFLLQTAADIEHALLVQYLYAAYSLPPNVVVKDPKTGKTVTTTDWSNTIRGIAQEEMGHLMSVQCLLRALGGPIGFDREHFPYRSQLYPFPFTLEPFTKKSLAKYVVAEMPDPALLDKSGLTPQQIEEIQERAARDSGGVPINHVGMLYDTLIKVVSGLKEADFRQDAIPYQPDPLDWNADEQEDTLEGIKVLPIRPLPDGSVTKLRDVALRALGIIARQGEGETPTTMATTTLKLKGRSHFERFLGIYQQFPDAFEPALPVAANPNTTVPLPSPWSQTADPETALQEQKNRPGRITNLVTRLWAHLFNVRYRILLAELDHYLLLPGNKPDPAAIRDRLRGWIFKEMDGRLDSSIASLAVYLAGLDQYRFPGFKAGAPFEVPYTFDLPDRGPDRWRLHRDLYEGSKTLVDEIIAALKKAGLPVPNLLDELTKFEDKDDGSGDTPPVGRVGYIDQHKDSEF